MLIVDDHAAFRASARALLQAEGFDVVGEAADGAAAVEAVAVLHPEIVRSIFSCRISMGSPWPSDSPRGRTHLRWCSSRAATAAYGPRLNEARARGFIPRAGCPGRARRVNRLSETMRRLGPAWLAGIMLGLAAEWVGFGWDDPRRWIPDLAVGWTLIGCGLIAWARRPESRTGPLMAATGFTWFLGNFAQVDVAPVAWVAIHTLYLHRGPLVHLVLTYPSGRPESPLVRGAVVVGCAVAIITPIWRSDGGRPLPPSPPANMSGRSAPTRAASPSRPPPA